MKPASALTHPLWMVALFLLVLNDHFLKGSGLLPGWLTGKLSDVAGLILAPAVLAVILRARSRRTGLVAHVATGVGFATINVSSAAARWVEGVSLSTPFPWKITVDPTDLFTLPALALGYLAWARVVEARTDESTIGRPSMLAQRLALIGGSLACMATSMPPEPGPPIPGTTPGSLAVGNATASERLFRVRRLIPSVQLDCARVAVDPSAILSRKSFADAEAWLVDSGRAVVLETTRDCDAALIDGDGLPMTLVYWNAVDFPRAELSASIDRVQADRLIAYSFEDHRVVLTEHPAVFAPPPIEDPEPTGACHVPGVEVGIDWSLPTPPFQQTLVGITESPDGCLGLELDGAPTYYVCMPAGAFPFAVGDVIEIRAGGGIPEQGLADPSTLDIIGATARVRLYRGLDVARWDGSTGLQATVEPVVGCAGQHDECGSYLIPVEVSIYGDDVPEITFLQSGDSAALDDGGTLFLVRAATFATVDTACTPWLGGPHYLETVLVHEEL